MNVMDATYLDIRSAHGHVWLVEWKQETSMAASSTICNVGRSRTSKSQFACMEILLRSGEHKNARWRLERVILFWVNQLTSTLKSFNTTWRRDGRKEGRKAKDREWGIRSARVNMHKPWETDLPNPLQHSDTETLMLELANHIILGWRFEISLEQGSNLLLSICTDHLLPTKVNP